MLNDEYLDMKNKNQKKREEYFADDLNVKKLELIAKNFYEFSKFLVESETKQKLNQILLMKLKKVLKI